MRYDHTLICHHSYLFQKIALSFIKRIYSFSFYKNIILNLVFIKKSAFLWEKLSCIF